MSRRSVGGRQGGGLQAPLWILGSVVVLVIAVVVVLEAFALANMRDSTLRNTETNLSSISVALAEQASRAFKGLDLVLDDVAVSLAMEAVVDGDSFRARMASQPVHEILRDRLTGLPHVETITLLDGDGNLMNGSSQWPPLLARPVDSDYLRALREDRTLTTFIGAPIRSGSGDGWVAPVVNAIRVRDGDLVGIVVGGLASITGSLVGALFVQFVPHSAEQVSREAAWAIYGACLLLALWIAPGGVAGLFRRVTGGRPTG